MQSFRVRSMYRVCPSVHRKTTQPRQARQGQWRVKTPNAIGCGSGKGLAYGTKSHVWQEMLTSAGTAHYISTCSLMLVMRVHVCTVPSLAYTRYRIGAHRPGAARHRRTVPGCLASLDPLKLMLENRKHPLKCKLIGYLHIRIYVFSLLFFLAVILQTLK